MMKENKLYREFEAFVTKGDYDIAIESFNRNSDEIVSYCKSDEVAASMLPVYYMRMHQVTENNRLKLMKDKMCELFGSEENLNTMLLSATIVDFGHSLLGDLKIENFLRGNN